MSFIVVFSNPFLANNWRATSTSSCLVLDIDMMSLFLCCTLLIACAKVRILFLNAKLLGEKLHKMKKDTEKICISQEKAVPLQPQNKNNIAEWSSW